MSRRKRKQPKGNDKPRGKRARIFSNDELIQRALMIDGRLRMRMAFCVQDPHADPTCGQVRLNRELHGSARVVYLKSGPLLRQFLEAIDALLGCISVAGEIAPFRAALEAEMAKFGSPGTPLRARQGASP